MRSICIISICALASVSVAQGLSAIEFEPTPTFTETFAGGATVGKWELDPANIAGAAEPSYVTSTPGGVDSTVTTLDPVATSDDQGVMEVGNPSSTNGGTYGLDYVRCVNSKSDGTGIDFTAPEFNKYRIIASCFLFSPTDQPDRWQVGPYGNIGGDLFRACAFYNTTSSGNGPGFGFRGSTTPSSGLTTDTAALTVSRWTKMSIMVDASDADTANWRMAICVDADGDGLLEEDDSHEFAAVPLNPTRVPGPFGLFTVGNVNSDTFPLFVDSVELYMPLLDASVNDWTIY